MLSAAGASLPAYADPQSPAAQLDAAIRQRNIAEATRLLQATDVAPSAPVEIPDKRRFSTDEMNTALQTALIWLPEVVPLLIEKAVERMSTSSAAASTAGTIIADEQQQNSGLSRGTSCAPLSLQDWLIGSVPGRERLENYAREPPLYSALRRGRVREARFLWGVILVVVLGIDLEQLPVEYALASELAEAQLPAAGGASADSELLLADGDCTAREGFVKGLRMQFGRVIAAASTARNLESEDDVIDLVDFVFGEVLVHLRDVLGVSGAEVRQLAKVGLGLAKPASNQTSGAWEPEVVSLLHVVASGSGSVAVCHRLLEHYDRLVVGPTTASPGGHPQRQESETARSGLTSCRFQGTKCDELLRKRCATRYKDAVLREVRARMPVGGGPGYRQGGLVTTPWLEDDGWDSLTAAVWYGNWRVVCWLVGVASFPDPLQERESGSGGAASGGVVTAISNRPQDGGAAASPNRVQTPTEWQRNLVNGQNWQQLTALDFVQHRIEKLEAAAAAPEEYEEKTYEFADEKSGKKVSHAWIGQRGRHGSYDRRTAQQLLNDLRRCELVLRKCGAKNGGGKHSRGGGCEGGCVVQ
eukprot:g4147.t1